MCGIYGVIGPLVNDSNIPEVAFSMGEALQRRGPDNIDFTNVPGGFIGHTRLSLVDLSSAGNQPMISENNNVLSFNGEIYNFKELKKNINGSLRSSSDTEILLRSIEENGLKNAIENCKGMFAFAYYSASTETLFLARDRMGEKPLYYSHNKESFIFSSDT